MKISQGITEHMHTAPPVVERSQSGVFWASGKDTTLGRLGGNMSLLAWEHLRIPLGVEGLRGSERKRGYHPNILTLIPIPISPCVRSESSVGAAAAAHMRGAPHLLGQKSLQTPHASHVRDEIIKTFISATETRGQVMLMKSLHFHFRHLPAAKITTVSERWK